MAKPNKILVVSSFKFNDKSQKMLAENNFTIVYKSRLLPYQLMDEITDVDYLVAFKNSHHVIQEALEVGKKNRLKAIAVVDEQIDPVLGKDDEIVEEEGEEDRGEDLGEKESEKLMKDNIKSRRVSLLRWLPFTASRLDVTILRNSEEVLVKSRCELLSCYILLMCRGMARHSSILKHGIWESRHRGSGTYHFTSGIELKEKTLGIVGGDSVAFGLAKRMMAFGMNVLLYCWNEEEAQDVNQLMKSMMRDTEMANNWSTCQEFTYLLKESHVIALTKSPEGVTSLSSRKSFANSGEQKTFTTSNSPLNRRQSLQACGGPSLSSMGRRQSFPASKFSPGSMDPACGVLSGDILSKARKGLFICGFSMDGYMTPDICLQGLNCGILVGAAFDDHLNIPELLKADPRFICTPSIANFTVDALGAMGEDLARQMIELSSSSSDKSSVESS